MSDKILSYHDVLLRHADAATLQDGCWINDQIIAFFFELLTHEHLSDAPSVALLPGASTYLLLNTPPHDLPAIAKRLFHALQTALAQHQASVEQLIQASCAQQNNGYDCGMHVLGVLNCCL